MLTKPDLKDEKIIECLKDAYGLNVATISFLPIGADFNTAVYRVTAHNGEDYFLKLLIQTFELAYKLIAEQFPEFSDLAIIDVKKQELSLSFLRRRETITI